ncbi:MAG: hypothetical protein UZ14_CFX002002449 [Chloroflexi bacterium OLB14]|nr:MAG: hypothetical protein UZ14_CFX002002449 [Chloroflexi bacterium OLB14]
MPPKENVFFYYTSIMNRKLLLIIIAILATFLISLLPIFPLVIEFREIYETGETLSQEWRFVSMPEFYEAADYARLGWLDSTWTNYLFLAVANHVLLIGIFLVLRKILIRFFGKN